MPRTANAESLTLNVDLLARYLDANWNGWRNGIPETSYCMYSPPGSHEVYIIGYDSRPGYLDIDGQAFYSDAWL